MLCGLTVSPKPSDASSIQSKHGISFPSTPQANLTIVVWCDQAACVNGIIVLCTFRKPYSLPSPSKSCLLPLSPTFVEARPSSIKVLRLWRDGRNFDSVSCEPSSPTHWHVRSPQRGARATMPSSSETEFNLPIPQTSGRKKGWASIEALRTSKDADRRMSKEKFKTQLEDTRGAPCTLEHRQRWSSRFDAYRLLQDPDVK